MRIARLILFISLGCASITSAVPLAFSSSTAFEPGSGLVTRGTDEGENSKQPRDPGNDTSGQNGVSSDTYKGGILVWANWLAPVVVCAVSLAALAAIGKIRRGLKFFHPQHNNEENPTPDPESEVELHGFCPPPPARLAGGAQVGRHS